MQNYIGRIAAALAVAAAVACSQTREPASAYPTTAAELRESERVDQNNRRKARMCYGELRSGFERYAQLVRDANSKIKKPDDIKPGTRIILPELRYNSEGIVYPRESVVADDMPKVDEFVRGRSVYPGRGSECWYIDTKVLDVVNNALRVRNHVWQ